MTRAARALIRLADRPETANPVCPGCRADATVTTRADVQNQAPRRFVDFQMTIPPVDKGFEFTGEIEPLTLCETCLTTAVRVLGLLRDPAEHPDVIKLTAARDTAFTRMNEALVEQQDARERLRLAEVA